MARCWCRVPAGRPTFSYLVQQLTTLHQATTDPNSILYRERTQNQYQGKGGKGLVMWGGNVVREYGAGMWCGNVVHHFCVWFHAFSLVTTCVKVASSNDIQLKIAMNDFLMLYSQCFPLYLYFRNFLYMNQLCIA